MCRSVSLWGGTLLCLISSAALGQAEGSVKWRYAVGGQVYSSSPAIGPDGTIYVGARDRKLHAVSPDGTLKWTYSTGNQIYSSPAFAPDGTIYFGSYDSKLYAVGVDGRQKWTYATGGEIFSSAAVSSDGTIYIGSRDGKLHAVNPDGTGKWTFQTGGRVDPSPAIGSDGTIYVGSWDAYLYAIDPDGFARWRFRAHGGIVSSPAIGSDGTIYVGSWDKHLYAVAPDGSLRWSYDAGDYVKSSPAIGSDGTIYVGCSDSRLHAVNPDGSPKWTYETGLWVELSGVAIGSDGVIYMGSRDEKLHAVNPDGSPRWTFETGGDIHNTPAIGSDGTLYAGSLDNTLYAIHSSSNGLAASPWPRYRHDNLNTGRVPPLAAVSGVDLTEFALFQPGETVTRHVEVRNLSDEAIVLASFDCADPTLVLSTALPITVSEDGSAVLELEVKPEETGLYVFGFQMACDTGSTPRQASGALTLGLFLDDHTERSETARHALAAYEAAAGDAKGSMAAENNRGVLYRLLGALDRAEEHLERALGMGVEAGDTHAGVMMNLGVVGSDNQNSEAASALYAAALEGLTAPSASVLAPQLTYNEVWEAYQAGNLDEAHDRIDEVVTHERVNARLHAKALALRGAILADKGDPLGARADFESALAMDAEGPIGRLAMDNLAVIDAAEGSAPGDELPSLLVLYPNYPNPFNPETRIGFALPASGKVSLLVYDGLGKRVRELHSGWLATGYHQVVWDGRDDAGQPVGSGVYLLEMRADGFVEANKMTLLR